MEGDSGRTREELIRNGLCPECLGALQHLKGPEVEVESIRWDRGFYEKVNGEVVACESCEFAVII